MKKIFTLLGALAGTALSLHAQTYLVENFDTAFTGTNGAPPGWEQTVFKAVKSTSDKLWLRNIYSGTTWGPLNNGTVPPGAVSGNSALSIDDATYASTSIPQSSARVSSPVVNLTGAVSPYLRFFYFNNQATGQTLNFRVMASANGGASWQTLTPIVNGFNTTVNTWNRINVQIPPAFRTSGMRFAFEITNRFGTNNPFIDSVKLEEYTPATITSAQTGDWNVPATWVGGVVPTSDNHVVIDNGHTVTVTNTTSTTGILARCQNLTVNGTLAYGSGTTNLLHAFGNILVNGTFNAFNGTSGRALYAGGNFRVSPSGTANFSTGTTALSIATTAISTGASAIIWLGNRADTFSVTGTLTNNRINNLIHLNQAGVVYETPAEVPYTVGLDMGVVNNSNLSLGSSGITAIQNIQVVNKSSVTTNWLLNTTVTRNITFYSPNWTPLAQDTIIPGNYIPDIGGIRSITGTLTMNTHNNVQLNYPLTVGTATTGGLTLTRGIIRTSNTNLLTLSPFISGSFGTTPSTTIPPTHHGSYIAGPLNIQFPSTGTTSRNFAVGTGFAFNDTIAPTANVRRTITLSPGTTAWSGQNITASIGPKPSGTVNAPANIINSKFSYQINLNGGADLPSTATLTLPLINYTFGNGANSDSAIGSQNQLFVIQSPSLNGPWTVRSTSTSSGVIANNVNYTRTTATTAPGPISPLASEGEYFSFGSSISLDDAALVSQLLPATIITANNTVPITMRVSVKNNGAAVTSAPISIRRSIDGTNYRSVKTRAAGMPVNQTDTILHNPFTGYMYNTTYIVRDTVILAGDTSLANDTLSGSFLAEQLQPTLVIWTDAVSRDSLVAQMNDNGYAGTFNLTNTLPAQSLRDWNNIFVLFASASSWSPALRDSLNSFLSVSTMNSKKKLLVFGNDVGYNNDPSRNTSALPADTVFLRQTLKARYIADNWTTSFPSSNRKFRGIGSYTPVTSDSLGTDPFPDLLTPVNGGTAAFIPLNESGNGDSCNAISYVGNDYNSFLGSNNYSAYSRRQVFVPIYNNIVNNMTLPVRFSRFTGVRDGAVNQLYFTTAAETNNKGFVIERSVDGRNFRSIGYVATLARDGYSMSPLNYTFTDHQPEANMTNYYRLRQQDGNGAELLSQVIALKASAVNGLQLTMLYPNPVNSQLNLQIDASAARNVQIRISDLQGRVMQVYTASLQTGSNVLSYPASQLGRGQYLVQVLCTDGCESMSASFIRQ